MITHTGKVRDGVGGVVSAEYGTEEGDKQQVQEGHHE